MRKRIGTKLYDTETAVLVDTTPEGVQIYRKKNSPQFFAYDPTGKNKHEMFHDLTPEEAVKYLPDPETESKTITNKAKNIKFSDYNVTRIKRLANSQGLSMAQFILMLVDRYEAEQNKDRSE